MKDKDKDRESDSPDTPKGDDPQKQVKSLESTFKDLKKQFSNGDISFEQMLQDLIAEAEAAMPAPEPQAAGPGPGGAGPDTPLGGMAQGGDQGLSLDQLG